MKKSIRKSESSKTMAEGVAAIGLDLSDRTGRFYAIDAEGLRIAEGSVVLLAPELQRWASSIGKTVIAIEAGTHSPWISRLLSACGHEVIVANPVKVTLITQNVKKTDPGGAEVAFHFGDVRPQLVVFAGAGQLAKDLIGLQGD